MKRTLLTLALLALCAPVSAETPQPGGHFVENWDVDGDGAVTLADIESRRADVFMTFDADENGVLDRAEYDLFDEARANDMKDNAGHGKGMRRASEGMTLAFNDADADGRVSRAEFLARSADWLAMLDRNGDGHVTGADFGRQGKGA
ncbi:EF-hand domain-containing protein [Cognatishimia sp. F0-27]|uniref:EF-hand domain-containing protein n=1 Tax=Cognatishimia sp. F0-27 TaxID=2816855 RepID=UPI001D0CB7BB|nr:EF-hand domain-containing protein [Cognatishimia sp. F0-27]MCC1493843.1 EF-hand domain-containing protein [Cognatishimia sp. F0-27]